MAVSTQVIRFTKEVTGVTNVTQDVALNFTPKAIIVFSDCDTVDVTVTAHYQWSQGFSDGTTHACVTITSDDADAAADTQMVHAGSVYVRMNEISNASVLERATCSFITNAVRFTWAVASTTATRICMWAIGGDDITNVKVNTVDVGTTGTGTVNYTGLGFNPVDGESVLFTLSSFSAALSNSSVLGASSHFGCAVSASKEWAIGNVMEDTRDPTDTWRVTYNNHCLVNLNETTGAVEYLAEFSAWITDGFQLNYTDAPAASTDDFSYLVIKGGTWDNGVLTAPTTITNDVDYAVSVSSRTLRGMMVASCNDITSGSIDTNAIVSVGASDGTNQAVIACIDEDALATVDSYRVNTTVNIAKPLGAFGSSSDRGTFDSFTTDNFRLDWPTKSANAQLYGWVVVADGPAGAAVVAVEVFSHSFGNINDRYDNNTGPTIFG